MWARSDFSKIIQLFSFVLNMKVAARSRMISQGSIIFSLQHYNWNYFLICVQTKKVYFD